tara:strand:- start:394 stop:903 length:510 start_codon:yes stop_codon:yes gene_type:complete
MANDNLRVWRYGSRLVVGTDLNGGAPPTANLFTPAHIVIGSGGTLADSVAKFLLPNGGQFKVKRVITIATQDLAAGNTAKIQIGPASDVDGVIEIELTEALTAVGVEQVFTPTKGAAGAAGALFDYVFTSSDFPRLRLHAKGAGADGDIFVMLEMEAVGGGPNESALGV